MSRPARDRQHTPRSSTGRRHRPSGWHEYHTLPRSRVPVLLSVFWMAYAMLRASLDIIGAIFSTRRPRRPRTAMSAAVGAVPAPRPPRAPRTAALTPRSLAAQRGIEYTVQRPTPAA